MQVFNPTITTVNHGVDLISLVESPAMQEPLKSKCDAVACSIAERAEFIAPVLIPDKKILRKTSNGIEFFIIFTKDVILKSLQSFIESNNLSKTDINHNGKVSAFKVVFFEHWIKESEEDKSSKFFDLPIGTWFTKFKIIDKKALDCIDKGNINGISVNAKYELILNNEMSLLEDLKLLVKGNETPTKLAEETKEEEAKEEKTEEAKEEKTEEAKEVAKEEETKTEEINVAEILADIVSRIEALEKGTDAEEATEMQEVKTELKELKTALSEVKPTDDIKEPTATKNEVILSLSESIKQLNK